MKNLVEGLLEQMNRCRRLIKEYEAIGEAGAFARVAITLDIRQAEKAMAGGDAVEMLEAYKDLESCQ
jgi:hypothetical protein